MTMWITPNMSTAFLSAPFSSTSQEIWQSPSISFDFSFIVFIRYYRYHAFVYDEIHNFELNR